MQNVISRKLFLKWTSLVTASLYLPFKTFGNNEAKIIEPWKTIIDYARWSPSPHNVQPWKLKIISATEAHLYYDPMRVPSVVDPSTAFTIVGMAMFIECIRIVAANGGFQLKELHATEEKLASGTKEYRFFAQLSLENRKTEETLNNELIKQRRTSRLHYTNEKVSGEVMSSANTIAQKYNHQFISTQDEEIIDYIIFLNSTSILKRSAEVDTREEMSHWIRTSDEESRATKDGLSYRGTGMSGKTTYNFIHHYNRYKAAWKQRAIKHRLDKTMIPSANMAWITGPFANRQDWVNAGKMLMRVWLSLAQKNIYIHPLGTVVTTQSAKEDLLSKINYNEKDGFLWFLIRYGYSETPPKSLRLDEKDILI